MKASRSKIREFSIPKIETISYSLTPPALSCGDAFMKEFMPLSSKGGRAHAAQNGKNLVLGGVCCLIIAGILIAGLWPFDAHPSNDVKRLQNENGIKFYGRGIVWGSAPLISRKPSPDGASLTIEILVRPYREYGHTVPTILVLYGDNQTEQFSFCQWKKEFLIRVPEGPGSRNRYKELSVGKTLIAGSPRLITVTADRTATSVYIDGKLERSSPHYPLMGTARQRPRSLVLGNTADGENPWEGAVLGLAVYDFVLNDKEVRNHSHDWPLQVRRILHGNRKPTALYLFNGRGRHIRNLSGGPGDLRMPEIFRPLQRTVLRIPGRDDFFGRSNLTDITLNILGFVPLGSFLFAWLLHTGRLTALRMHVLSVFLGLCLSLGIELAQVFMPPRDSSLLDVFCNTVGTTAGSYLAFLILPGIRQNRKRSQNSEA